MSGAQASARRVLCPEARLLLAGALAIVAAAMTALVGAPAPPGAAATSGTPTAAAAATRARVDGLASLRRLALATAVTTRDCGISGSSAVVGPASTGADRARLDRPTRRLAILQNADPALHRGEGPATRCPRGPPGSG